MVVIGLIGSGYAIFGGLKAVAYSDTINGIGLFVGGLAVPILALLDIGDGNVFTGLSKAYQANPEKFNVIGASDSVLPFSALFTGLVINQLYFWGMNQMIIQRALGAKNLKEGSTKRTPVYRSIKSIRADHYRAAGGNWFLLLRRLAVRKPGHDLPGFLR